MPRGKQKTVEELKTDIWKHCLDRGWTRPQQPLGMNCLYRKEENVRVRLRFEDSQLFLEKKRPLSDQEKVLTHKNAKWEVLEQAEYKSVEVNEQGMTFKKEQKAKK